MEEAFTEAKRRLRLSDKSEHEEYLRNLPERNLTSRDGKLYWPPAIRSALVYWAVKRE